jgi:nucleotide-binding universal stress UspA family protein
MYQKVLVPLDGSELAEAALPQVRNLAAGGFIGEVVLLSVVEIDLVGLPLTSTGIIDLPALRKEHCDRFQEYLRNIRDELAAEGINARAVALEGRSAKTIVDYANTKGVDLIVIASHGYSGMKKLMFGSVALRVLHEVHAPVLLIRPESCR